MGIQRHVLQLPLLVQTNSRKSFIALMSTFDAPHACRKLSLRFHPDKAAAEEKDVATAVFVLIKAAAEKI